MDERKEYLESLAAGIRSRASSKLGDIWWAFMLRGVFAGVLGIFALIWPTPSFTILTRVTGLYFLADAMPGLVGALRAPASGTYLLQAVVSLVAGGVLLFLPSASARTLLMVLGGWALFTGIGHILAARRTTLEDNDRGLVSTTGRAAAAVGLVLLIWPGTGVVAISWIIALAALLLAALLIFLALRLKRLQKRVDNLASLGSTK
jgi:uncharacterized membrane protein HdeD (DUF308 family)